MNNCSIHRAEVACGTCVHCGKVFCSDCLVDMGGRHYCRDDVPHGLAAAAQIAPQLGPAQPQAPMIFMNAGGGAAAVATQKKGVNHLLHAILTLCTGFWLFVWIFLAITNRD